MNFFYPEHNVVFIHIPKNAGSSMHAALGGKKEGPIGGRLPKEWSNCPCFTIVRNPFTRFLSGLNMFRMGAVALNNDDFYSQPRLPDLTAAQAMDILMTGHVGRCGPT